MSGSRSIPRRFVPLRLRRASSLARASIASGHGSRSHLARHSLLYRIVEGCPPDLDDFRSYEVLGRPYNRRDFFKGVGVSMRTTRERAIAIARYYRQGRAVATVDIRGAQVAWARTGGQGQTRSGVWLKPDPVVQCDEHE